jgi:hypothetical protein
LGDFDVESYGCTILLECGYALEFAERLAKDESVDLRCGLRASAPLLSLPPPLRVHAITSEDRVPDVSGPLARRGLGNRASPNSPP